MATDKETYICRRPGSFSKCIDLWEANGRSDSAAFVIGSTGSVIQGLGAIESDIYIRGEKINNILATHPEMDLNSIKKIPNILKDPVLVLKSKNVGRGNRNNTRIVIFGSEKASNNLPIVTVLDIRPIENHFVVEKMQKVTSAYTKTKDVISFVRESEVMYLDKKRTTLLLRTIGFQMPIDLHQSGFIGNISYRGHLVKLSGIKFESVVSVPAQKISLDARIAAAQQRVNQTPTLPPMEAKLQKPER